jgi:hypothetical protein
VVARPFMTSDIFYYESFTLKSRPFTPNILPEYQPIFVVTNFKRAGVKPTSLFLSSLKSVLIPGSGKLVCETAKEYLRRASFAPSENQ